MSRSKKEAAIKKAAKPVTGNGANGVEHELINALNIIQPAAQRIEAILAQDGHHNPETLARIRNYLHMILRNTARMTNLARRLNTLALQPEENSR